MLPHAVIAAVAGCLLVPDYSAWLLPKRKISSSSALCHSDSQPSISVLPEQALQGHPPCLQSLLCASNLESELAHGDSVSSVVTFAYNLGVNPLGHFSLSNGTDVWPFAGSL
ncbi:hypothetical protein IF2G_01417 [Cordyceps javanica]|nr:hypothetical protein IF2G_01417 [Cordyceps javanica]